MPTKIKSEFSYNTLYSGYTRTKTDEEKELDKKLFHGKKTNVAKLAIHGFYKDTSMAANDREILRKKMQLKRKQSSMNRLNTNFEKEVQKVKALQKQLAEYQESMAVTALEKYTITYIQTIWRGYLARKKLKFLKAHQFLRTYIIFRHRWKIRTRASRIIKNVYQRYSILTNLKRLAVPSQKARIIQKAYRRRFLQTRGIIRYRAHQMWQHVQLFGKCRAKNVLCPVEREKRIVYNMFLRFHQRIRARRVFNAANVNKLFLGLYFCQTPLAQKRVKESASHLNVPKRGGRGRSNPINALLTMRPSVLSRGLQTSLMESKATLALEQYQKRQEKETIKDTLSYFKRIITKTSLKKMGSKVKNTPLLGNRPGRRAVSPNIRSGGGRRGITPPNPGQRQRSPGGGRYAPTDRGTSSFVTRKIMLDSVTSYRKTVQNYKIPKGLINLSSYSQLDSNSIFANQLSSTTNKVIPYELKGFFRLKTFAEVVFFIQDLAAATIKCPELLVDPFEESNLSLLTSRKCTSDDLDIDVNLLKDSMADNEILESIEQTIQPFYDLFLQDKKAATGQSAKGGKKGGKKKNDKQLNKSASSVTGNDKQQLIKSASSVGGGSDRKGSSGSSSGNAASTATAERKGSNNNNGGNSRRPSTISRSASTKKETNSVSSVIPNNKTINDTTKPKTPPGKNEIKSNNRKKDVIEMIPPAANTTSKVEKVTSGSDKDNGMAFAPTPTSTSVTTTKLPDVKQPTGEVEENDFQFHFAKKIKEEEIQFFAKVEKIHKEVLIEQEEKKTRRKPSLSVLTTPQLSQSTTTVPDMTLLDSLSHISQASSLDSDDDEYGDDFDSLSGSRVGSANEPLRPSRPTTPIPSSAYYRRQNIMLGAKKET